MLERSGQNCVAGQTSLCTVLKRIVQLFLTKEPRKLSKFILTSGLGPGAGGAPL